MATGISRRRAGASNALLLAGLLTQAATTYGFLILAGRSLGDARFGALSGLYILLTSVATGLFQPLEQEITRRRGRERVLGSREQGLSRRALTIGVVTALAAAAVALVLFPLTQRVLGDDAHLVPIFCLGLPAYAVWFGARGELAGAGRLARYGAQLALDGGVRLALGVLVVALEWDSTVTLSLLFAISPWVAVALTARRPATQRDVGHDDAPPTGGAVREPLARPYYLLVVSALAAQLLMNAGPVVIGLIAAPAERAEVGVFLAALVLIRVPVFLFTAVQPSFLPLLAARAASDDPSGFRRLLGLVTAALLGLVALCCVGVLLLGPPVVALLFSFDHGLPRLEYLLLTAAVGLFLVSTVQAQALVALGRHSRVTVGWVAGLLGLGLGTQLGHGAVVRATNGLLLGAVVTTIVLTTVVVTTMRRWRSSPNLVRVGAAG